MVSKSAKLNSRQRLVLKPYLRKGFQVESIVKAWEREMVEVRLQYRASWDFPWCCPYANSASYWHEIRLVLGRAGSVSINYEREIHFYWSCDYPRSQAMEPVMRIYRGIHPLLPVQKVEQLKLPLD